jgi:hypothetical protein
LQESDDQWIRHHHRLIELGGGPVVLGTMYDNLTAVVGLRPGTVVVPSAVGAVQETYELLADALREPGPGWRQLLHSARSDTSILTRERSVLAVHPPGPKVPVAAVSTGTA